LAALITPGQSLSDKNKGATVPGRANEKAPFDGAALTISASPKAALALLENAEKAAAATRHEIARTMPSCL